MSYIPNFKITVGDVDRIASMAKAGYSVRQIKIVLAIPGVRESEIERVIHDLGLPVRERAGA